MSLMMFFERVNHLDRHAIIDQNDIMGNKRQFNDKL